MLSLRDHPDLELGEIEMTPIRADGPPQGPPPPPPPPPPPQDPGPLGAPVQKPDRPEGEDEDEQ